MAIRESVVYDQPDQLILSGSQRLALAGTQRLRVWNDDMDQTGTSGAAYDPVNVGTPRRSRVSFVVQDGWELAVEERLTLMGAVRATVQLTGQIIISDYGQNRARLVLAGSKAGQ